LTVEALWGYNVYPSREIPEVTPPQDKIRGSAGPGSNPKRLWVGSPIDPTPIKEASAGGSAPSLTQAPRISAEEKGKKVIPETGVIEVYAQDPSRKENSGTIKEVQEKRKDDKRKGKEEGKKEKEKKKDKEKKADCAHKSPKEPSQGGVPQRLNNPVQNLNLSSLFEYQRGLGIHPSYHRPFSCLCWDSECPNPVNTQAAERP
jgi:hypothetical protein